MRVFLRIVALDIPLTGASCQGAILQIYDGASAKEIKEQFVGVCGSALPHVRGFTSSGTDMTLVYHQGLETIHKNKSFNLTFTYFTSRKNGCRETEFQCHGNRNCISSELVCDGIDNCEDASDESSDYDACGKFLPSSNPAVGSSVGILMLLILVALLTGLGFYGAKRRMQVMTSCSQLPVTNNQTTATTSVIVQRCEEGSSGISEISPPAAIILQEGGNITTYHLYDGTPNSQRRRMPVLVTYEEATGGDGGLNHTHQQQGSFLRTISPPPTYDSLYPVAV